jgi:hypothetical protein
LFWLKTRRRGRRNNVFQLRHLELAKKAMKLLHCIAALALTLTLAGCATATSERMREVREFAAGSARLDAFSELTTHYRDTYERARPYLTADADAREQVLDARRRAAYHDFIGIHKAVVLYMQTLGRLAGADPQQQTLQRKDVGSAISAWPDSGVDERHVHAYGKLTLLLAQALSAPYQDSAVRAMVSEGDAPLRSLLEAMGALLRYYDKTSANEKRIVLGLFEVEIAFADAPRDRLLATLAKAHHQRKETEYGLVEQRHRLAGADLAAIAESQRTLAAHLAQQGGAALPAGNDEASAGHAGDAANGAIQN